MSKLHVTEIIAEAFMIKPERIFEQSRLRDVIDARHFAMWVYRTKLHHSPSVIARRFNKNHATVIHAVNKVEHLRDKDFEYKKKRALKSLEDAGIFDETKN